MTLSPLIHDCSDACHSRWLSAGSAQARIGSLDSPAVTPPILSFNAQTARSRPQAHSDAQPVGNKKPRILHIIDDTGQTELSGFYIRLPESAFKAYGDLLPECESRGVVWAGNKILYVASDAVSASFQYEIRLDEIVAADVDGTPRAEGALPLARPFQEMYGGAHFPIPHPLEPFLVPTGNAEIRLELHCDWIDMRTARHWAAEE